MSDPTWVGPTIQWLTIVAGWVVVNHQHNTRETRKEIRASLLDLYRHLDSIEDAAFRYHTGTGDPLEARKIKRDIHQIAARIVMARRGHMRQIEYARPLGDFRRSITLANFETAEFKKKEPQDPFFDAISAAKQELISSLERAYSRAYPR